MVGNKTPTRRKRAAAAERPAPAETARKAAPARKAKPAARAAATAPRSRNDVATSISAVEKRRMIEIAAYFRAERRGFQGGSAHEDWAAAEAEVEAQLASVTARKPVRRTRKTPAA